MMTQVDEDLKELVKQSVDVELLLISLGFKVARTGPKELRAPCRVHGGDNPTAFSIRTDTRKWKCFTKKCEQGANGQTSNDLISLVMRVNGCNFITAFNYLADISGVDVRSAGTSYDTMRRDKEIKRFTNSVKRASSFNEVKQLLTEEEVAAFVSARDDYFLKAGFLPSTLEYFEIGAKYDKFGIKRATIPIRDHRGIIVGVSSRREDSDKEPRYLIESSFEKGKVLYNLHRALESKPEYLILVEGFKACWAVHEAGFSNVIACMGSSITEDQVNLLVSSNISKCIVMLDGDAAGRRGTESSLKMLGKAFNVHGFYLPDDVSPDSEGFSRSNLREFIDFNIECL